MYRVVNTFMDRDGTKYKKGDSFDKKLSSFRRNQLTTEDNGFGIVFLKRVSGKPKTKSAKVKYPKHVGGGWYELSDGERVQGPKEAKELESKIDSK